jgi:leucyl-tRNA synthetase
MSKSRGNVVPPTPIINKYGADSARCYILFIGPPDQDAPWNDSSLEGVHRFLSRLYRLGSELSAAGASLPASPSADALSGDALTLVRKAHWAIDKVTRDLDGRFAFHTAISAILELVNELYKYPDVDPDLRTYATATAASLVFPFAPHIGCEVYELLTGERVWEQPWPSADPAMLVSDSFELVCQVMGKVRDRVQAETSADNAELERLALAAPGMQAWLEGKEIVRVVVVPGKLVNVVVK